MRFTSPVEATQLSTFWTINTMEDKDKIILISPIDINEGRRIIEHIDRDIIPNMIDADGNKSEIGKDERYVLIACALASLSPEAQKGEDGFVSIETTPAELFTITQAVRRYEEAKDDRVLGAIVSILRAGDLSNFVKYYKTTAFDN